MDDIKELLEIRKQIKSKKPKFIRRDTNKKKRLKKNWRRPTGLHSKLRGRFKGRPKRVSQGYRSPKKVRGLHKSGLQQAIVNSLGDLKGMDAKKNCIIISSSVGDKKRIDILKKAKEQGFDILNINNPEEYIKNVEEKINLRKKAKKEGHAKKSGRETRKKEEKLTEKVAEEESKKDIEKKEKDKVLIRKDN